MTQGYWWHGYPIGPFSSQEIGSGSIFANTRVAFVTNTQSEEDVMFGVACTECSISGHFFRYFPVTYFFHPRHSNKVVHGNLITKSLYKNDFFRLMKPEFDRTQPATIEWCFKMLRSQFWLNMPKRITSCTVNVDKWSGLRVEGFLPKPTDQNSRFNRVKSLGTDTTSFSKVSPFNRFSGSARDKLVFRIINKNGKKWTGDKVIKECYKSQLFVDEDEWAIMDRKCPMVSVDGWIPIRSLAKYDKVSYEAIIFVHGYNLTLAQACAQLSHFISFSKLPPYIVPFLFHWPGKYWGQLSAFAYPIAKKSAESTNVGKSMAKFLRELQKMGIVRLHFLAHSCGARVFFNGLYHCVSQGLFRRIVSSGDDEPPFTDSYSQPEMVLQSCVLINPDYSLEKFVNSDFFTLRTYCDSIIIYADTRDQCLTMSSLWNKERVVGKSIFGLATNKANLSCLVADHRLAKSYTLYPEMLHNPINNSGDNNCDESTQNSNSDQKSEMISKISWLNPRKRNGRCRPSWKGISDIGGERNIFGNVIKTLEDTSSQIWLDLDVVDMSTIDSNVDFLK